MSRLKIEEYSTRFAFMHSERCQLVRSNEDSALFAVSGDADALWPTSPATSLIRSAAAVEQMINGITVRLWDNPFEWTLPERMPTGSHLAEYFKEVEEARVRGFEFLKDDADLGRSLPAPLELKKLEEILTEAIGRSEKYLSIGRQMLSEGSLSF